MTKYWDPETGMTYDKGPSDFFTEGNDPWIYGPGGRRMENPNFDQEQYDKDKAEWEEYTGVEVSHYDVPEELPQVPEEHEFGGSTYVPPAIPGGADTPGKGVLTVNTDALRV